MQDFCNRCSTNACTCQTCVTKKIRSLDDCQIGKSFEFRIVRFRNDTQKTLAVKGVPCNSMAERSGFLRVRKVKIDLCENIDHSRPSHNRGYLSVSHCFAWMIHKDQLSELTLTSLEVGVTHTYFVSSPIQQIERSPTPFPPTSCDKPSSPAVIISRAMA